MFGRDSLEGKILPLLEQDMERATPPAFDCAACVSKHCGRSVILHVGGFTILTVPR